MPGSKVGNSLRLKGPTTNRVHRHENDSTVPVGNFAPTALTPAPPPLPIRPPRSLGDFSTASPKEIIKATADHFSQSEQLKFKQRGAMRDFLGHLGTFPGATWQEWWEASGHDQGNPVGDVAGDDKYLRNRLNRATGYAFAMRLVRPTLVGFRCNRFFHYAPWFCGVANDPWLEEFCARADQLPMAQARRTRTKFDVCCALTVFGIDLKDLTPEALLHYAIESRNRGLAGERADSGSYAGTLAWPILHEMGQFPASAPRTFRAAVTRGQISVEESVDRHNLRNREVRDVLVEYIRRRSAGLDYSTLRQLTNLLIKVFWKQIEEINPDQTDLRLSEETFTQWKEWLLVLPGGNPRLDVDGPLMAVRALYLDLHTWAVAEPERWTKWVAPCPVRDADLRWFHLRRRRLQERMANRTRDRQPLLPVLSQHVNDTWHRLRSLLEAAQQVENGEEFVADGTTWLRVSTKDQRHNRPPVRAVNRSTGELVHLSRDENTVFWQWAVVETLRLAGLRAEELTELTHLSVRQYQRSSGEVVALLVVSPSKSDRERVIPMSAELFHVIAQIIRRHRDQHGTVPVCTRYDLHERVWSEELPYLFQTFHGGTQRGMSTTTIWRMIKRSCDALAVTHPQFQGVKFAPHDFRRLFATELVNNGLPIHIGAALLGHLDIRTTRGYVAVFDEDVISQYQQFLARRRAERPKDEYRDPSTEEWSDFQQHFDKRRVELGSCGRPYGTSCAHEHACIRCPMLSINPKMLPRLDELEQDLVERRKRAVTEDWQGEIEGIDLTLTFLRGKRGQAQRFQRSGTVDLGLPHQRPPLTDG
ncbi:site-specific integrase [Streptomyces sp. NBC_01142]|uniref:tyrosine-type recombinase/integrase n=1 Tax=Streptomyces sp. NBC_01142 TaxID=2975865 RepID=UPI002252B477|nr:site-specific integrase [Streptomyces sp. NBC_01142]MCX4826105.1 site-specific integrase [Streptomyces sp. NBC_01142]